MPAMKDKCIVIPLDEKDIVNTVECLPRLPSESGIIDIQWKRRVGQKNAHIQAKVDPDKIFNALAFLKASGNIYYQNTQNREEYEDRCNTEDPEGFQLIFGEEVQKSKKLELIFIPDDKSEPIMELDHYNTLIQEQQTEKEFKEEDVVRKFQIDYDESICMVQKYPEAMGTNGILKPLETEEDTNDASLLVR